MTGDQLPFQLELDDGHGLVHLGGQMDIDRVVFVFVQDMGRKDLAGIIAVDLGRKHRQRTEIDAITIFENIKAVVADTEPDHIGHAGQATCCRSHPEDVVVAPLDIDIMEINQGIHDRIGARSAVEDITDDMQFVDGKLLDQDTQAGDEILHHAGLDDRADTGLVERSFAR